MFRTATRRAALAAALAAALGLLALTGVVGTPTATAGATAGPSLAAHTVRAYDTDVFHVTFYGGETARVLIAGDGDTDLDLVVFDEYGNEVASDTDSTDRCVAVWTPRWTGRYRIEVRNLGRVYNRYQILHN